MKILHILGAIYPERGGPAKVVLDLCRALKANAIDVTIFTTNLNYRGTLDVPANVPVLQKGVPVYHFSVLISRRFGYSQALAAAIRSQIINYDLVHIHSLYMYHTSIAGYYCRKYNIPYIIRPHGTLDPFLRKKSRIKKAIYNTLFEYRNLNNAAAIHYTSEDEMKLAHQAMQIKSPAVVVPLGLHLEEYSDSADAVDFLKKYPECENKFVYLFLGRIDFKKGLDLISHAFGNVAREREDVHLVIAGPDETGYSQKIQKWLIEEGVLDKTTFTGMLYERDKLAAFRFAQVFLLPSYTENLGIALLEAMLCKMAVVISDKVNIFREIEENNAGFITHCEINELTKAMLSLHDDYTLRKRLGRNAQKFVMENYSWGKNISLLIQVYEKIISNDLGSIILNS